MQYRSNIAAREDKAVVAAIRGGQIYFLNLRLAEHSTIVSAMVTDSVAKSQRTLQGLLDRMVVGRPVAQSRSEAELLRNDSQAITDVCVGRGCRLHIVGPDARHHAELISRLDVALAEDETLDEDEAELVAA